MTTPQDVKQSLVNALRESLGGITDDQAERSVDAILSEARKHEYRLVTIPRDELETALKRMSFPQLQGTKACMDLIHPISTEDP